MASLVLKMSISLDGYVAPADGRGDWKVAGRSDDARDWVVETVSNAGAHLVGAVTYADLGAVASWRGDNQAPDRAGQPATKASTRSGEPRALSDHRCLEAARG